MFRSYLLTAWRNLVNNKRFTFINIFGLSLSLAVCMLLTAVVIDQYAYDSFFTNKDRIYRVNSINNIHRDQFNLYGSTTFPLLNEIAARLPEAEEVVGLNRSFGGDIRYDETIVNLQGLYATKNFFRVFDFDLVGEPIDKVLADPYSMVLQEETAKKLFGEQDPLGKTVSLENFGDLPLPGSSRRATANRMCSLNAWCRWRPCSPDRNRA